MIIDASKYKSKEFEDIDVCIMGGGVAGIVLATELSKSNLKIVILESGAEQFDMEKQALYAAKLYPKNFPDPTYSRLRYLGGASNHWQNNTAPLDPIDFEKRSWIPNSGWPITYAELNAFYPLAASYCGTHDDGYETEHWSESLNRPNLVKNSKTIETGISKFSVPPTRFFAEYGGVLKKSQSVTIIENANVVDVQYDKNNETISNVTFESSPGQSHRLHAKKFVMCFGGIENARMLLEFNDKNEQSLGNKYDNVGRYFMEHPVVRAANLLTTESERFGLYQGTMLEKRFISGYFKLSDNAIRDKKTCNLRMPLIDASNYTLSDGISSFHEMKQSFSQTEIPDNFGSHLFNMVSDLDMVIEAVSRKAFDTPMFDHADELGGFEMQLMVEQSPERNNRITLSEEKDLYGIRKINIEWVLSETDKKRMWKSLSITANELSRLGLGRLKLLKEREDRIWGDQLSFGNHHMGTTRMSDSSKHGVVDKNLKVFGTENFYIGGCSVFPTGGHVPPTLTLVALSVRLAEHLTEELKNA